MKLVDKIKSTNLFYKFLKTSYAKKFYIKRGVLLDDRAIDAKLNLAPPLFLDANVTRNLKVGIVKDGSINIDGYAHRNSSWIFFERFCKTNRIPYGFYDIYRDDWIEKAKDFDIIIWHTNSSPIDMYIAESKLYILEKFLKKECFPSFHEAWQYEDKVRSTYLYKVFNLPLINTFVSNSEKDTEQFVYNSEYPVIFKSLIGAGSRGVKKIDNLKQAIKLSRKIFSNKGLSTPFPYYQQKNTVFFQKFISDATFDLRIIIVGNKAFGYYRYPKKNDFKASGSGIYEKREIPYEALDLAIKIKSKLDSRMMGIDLLYSELTKEYMIIETSLFNQIDTPEQLVINGLSGYYDISSSNYVFKPGKFWIHELLIEELIKNFNLYNKK